MTIIWVEVEDFTAFSATCINYNYSSLVLASEALFMQSHSMNPKPTTKDKATFRNEVKEALSG